MSFTAIGKWQKCTNKTIVFFAQKRERARKKTKTKWIKEREQRKVNYFSPRMPSSMWFNEYFFMCSHKCLSLFCTYDSVADAIGAPTLWVVSYKILYVHIYVFCYFQYSFFFLFCLFFCMYENNRCNETKTIIWKTYKKKHILERKKKMCRPGVFLVHTYTRTHTNKNNNIRDRSVALFVYLWISAFHFTNVFTIQKLFTIQNENYM